MQGELEHVELPAPAIDVDILALDEQLSLLAENR